MDTTPASFQHEKESLENDSPTESSACRDVMKEKTFNLPPVLPFSSGEGLPYAPEGWPNPGDIWTWKVGRRSNKSGYFHDRYLYLPKSLQKPPHKGANFQSKLEVIRFLESNFPNMKIEEFFALFSWKVLSTEAKGNVVPIAAVPLQQISVAEESDLDCDDGIAKCKAGNKDCNSLVLEEVQKFSPAMPCDICCTEPGFCRDCSCILCCKTVSSAYGGFNYIKCKVKVGEGICGHVAHMECGVRARLAGTVGRSIGLDAEYYCRRCDGRTDLISHVNNILQTCETGSLEDEIQKKILSLGACLLRGSKKPVAKVLLNHIKMAISKLEGIQRVDDRPKAQSAGLPNNGDDMMEVTTDGKPLNARTGKVSYDHLPPSLRLEAVVDDILQDLRRSQEFEYEVAEERLQEHKTYLKNLYQQLDTEKAELACHNSSRSDSLSGAVRKREEQIRQEEKKLKVMTKVGKGFGKTPRNVLEEHFGLEMEE